MLEKFKKLGGKLEVKKIDALTELTESYDIVINSSGWEAKFLTDDNLVYPIRGQTETFVLTSDLKNDHSLNVERLTAYVVFRPIDKGGGDCVIGTTFQNGLSTIVHCYGHGGSGYSASWESAHKVLKCCNNFISELKAIPRSRI